MMLTLAVLQFATFLRQWHRVQFAAEGEERYHNRAAVLHLSAPDYATPAVESFEAVLPRPEVSGQTLVLHRAGEVDVAYSKQLLHWSKVCKHLMQNRSTLSVQSGTVPCC